jgi:hypothetical protein
MNRSIALLFLATMMLGASEGGCGDGSQQHVAPLETCSPENCAGCCSGNQCVGGSTTDACGNGGSNCSACIGLTSCTPDEQDCDLAPEASVTVQPTEASIVPQDPRDNLDWDVDGSAPDVVVELRCPTAGSDQLLVTRTPEVSSFTPQWTSGGCTTQIGALLGRELQIKFIDVDSLFDDEIISANYTLKAEEIKAGSVSLSIPGYVNTVTLKFSRPQ